MASETIWLQRANENVPWGFRLYGGYDFHCALSVQKVTGGSIAARGLNSGDVILRIGETETGQLTHAQAMMAIKNAGNTLQLSIARSGTAVNAGSGEPSYQATSYPPPPPLQTASSFHRSVSNDAASHGFGSPYQTNAAYPFSTQNSTGSGYQNGNYDSMTSSYDATEPDFYSTGLGGGGLDDYGGTTSPEAATVSGYGAPTSPPVRAQPAVPDAVLNMAAKGPKDKQPFAYVADVNDIREQRDRVRKRTPGSTLPRYQHMLNMPQFEEPPSTRRVRSTPPPPDRPAVPSDTVVAANLQFNTPLGLYSSDNVVEALQGQSGGEITTVVSGLPKKDKGDITQSAVYKMIHGLDQPKPKPVIAHVEGQHQSTPPPRQPSTEDETRFSGLQNRSTDIPSKSFQRLQSWTGSSGSENTAPPMRRNERAPRSAADDIDSERDQYDEKSIRYTGRNIPSRSFRLLQQMTGSPDGSSSPARELASDEETRSGGIRSRSETPKRSFQTHQPQQQYQQQPSPYQQQQQQPVNVGGSEIDTSSIRHHLLGGAEDSQDVGQYDQTSIRYTGKSIPSRSFRMLQHLTGGDPGTPPVQQQQQPRASSGRQQPQQRRYRTPSGQDSSRDQQAQPPTGEDAAAKDIRYAGSSIPSQSFRMLQQSVGGDATNSTATEDQPERTDGVGVNGGDMLQSTSLGRKVKVVRLRSQLSTEDTGATEF